jgi:hypothetical protein
MPMYFNIMADGGSVILPHSNNFDVAIFETVQEVQIQTSTFSAQYGIGGAVFNQISKGGTNQWHGAGYEYLRNNYFNSRTFNSAAPLLRWDNFGGSIGGPVVKNKMFFVLQRRQDYQQWRELPLLQLSDCAGSRRQLLGCRQQPGHVLPESDLRPADHRLDRHQRVFALAVPEQHSSNESLLSRGSGGTISVAVTKYWCSQPGGHQLPDVRSQRQPFIKYFGRLTIAFRRELSLPSRNGQQRGRLLVELPSNCNPFTLTAAHPLRMWTVTFDRQ